MRNMLLGLATSLVLIGCGGKACDELKNKVCEGDAECVKAFDKDMNDGPKDEKLSDSDKNTVCKMILDEKEAVEGMKKSMKRKGGAGKPAEDKKEEKKEDKKEEKKEGGW